VIQYEYAVKYLEQLGIEPNSKNIANLLKHAPLTSCQFNSGWNNSRYESRFNMGSWLADVLYITPNQAKKNTFESKRDTFLAMKEQNKKSD